MGRPNILVLGGNFAGLTAALELRRLLGNGAQITLVSKSRHFLFIPSLIWVPFGLRKERDLTFDIEPVLARKGIHFHLDEVRRVDPGARQAVGAQRSYSFEYLVIATGFRPLYDVVPGLTPGENTYCLTNLQEAIQAYDGWKKFVDDPGSVVIGATQGAGCFGAAYEFLFNFAYQVKKAGVHRRTKLTYVTAEPFPGHFGIGGLKGGEAMLRFFFKWLDVSYIGNAAIKEIVPGVVRLHDGGTLPYKYAMIMPPFGGAEMVLNSPGLGDGRGLIPVRPTYQHVRYDNIYAAGASVDVKAPYQTTIATGVPKTGYPAEVMARTAARNIAAQVKGEPPRYVKPFGEIPALCVMDAGNMGVLIVADKMLPPRKFQLLVPGPQAHWAKVLFEKYFLWKMQRGYVSLP